MSEEFSKVVADFIIHNVSFSIIVILLIITLFCKVFFSVTKKEINPLGWIGNKIGKAFTKEVSKDISDLKSDTTSKMEEIKQEISSINTDHYSKIDSLREEMLEYRAATVQNINDLKSDLDSFEQKTNGNINQLRDGTSENCEIMKTELNNIKKSNDIQTIRQIRNHILDFANSCRNGRKHTQEEFRSVFEENKEYERIVAKYDDIINDFYVEAYAYIKRIYQHCLDTNDFLA